MTYPAKNVSVSINRAPQDVYKYAANPENLPKWAAGLAGAEVKRVGNDWIMESPMGKVMVKFAPENSFGVLDHDVTLPSGEINHNPFRVVKNHEGSEIIFTVYRLPRMTDPEFEKDTKSVEKDLLKLKSILEDPKK
jgi:uncharacterized protein YndB with AHSA1/START domain